MVSWKITPVDCAKKHRVTPVVYEKKLYKNVYICKTLQSQKLVIFVEFLNPPNSHVYDNKTRQFQKLYNTSEHTVKCMRGH